MYILRTPSYREMSSKFVFLLFLPYTFSANMTESKFVLNLVQPDMYDRRERPLKNENGRVVVEVSVYFTHIGDIDELHSDVPVSIFLEQMWIDPRLNFKNHPNFTNIITLHGSVTDMIWLPDLYFRNGVSDGEQYELTVPNIMLTLSPSGLVYYRQRLSTRMICYINLHYYPMDSQNCTMEIESLSYGSEDFMVKWREDMPQLKFIDLPQFNLSHVSFANCTSYYIVGNVTGRWSCISLTLHFNRLLDYYIIHMYGPSIMIVVLSWFSFWIDIHAVQARTSVGLLTFLTITTQLSGFNSKLPKVSYIKSMDVWMFVCTAFVFAALLEYSVINILVQRSNNSMRKQKNYGEKINSTTTTENQNNRSIPAKEDGDKPSGDINTENLEKSSHDCACRGMCDSNQYSCALRVDLASKVLFPSCFIIFNAFYWVYYGKLINSWE